MLREHAADDVFVDIDAKDTRNLLGNAGTASPGIAAFEFDDRVNEFLRWALWTGPSMTSGGEKPTIFAFLERLVAKRSNEFRLGARRRARPLMSNCCFNNKDSATTARTPPGRMSLAMVASKWTASASR